MVLSEVCIFPFSYLPRNSYLLTHLPSYNLGIAGLIILAALIFFCLRKRRKDIFDGNFDPAIVGSSSGGGGTLPKIDLGENGLLMDSNGVGVDEDDGMGGRLAVGPGNGGIITPYSFQPADPAPIGGMAIGGGQYQGGVGGQQQFQGGQLQGPQPQMQQMSNMGVGPSAAVDGAVVGAVVGGAAGAAALTATGYPNEKRAMRQQQQQYGRHTPNQSVSSGSLYPSSTQQMMLSNPNGSSPEPEPYSADGSSSFGGSGGSGSGGIYYQTMGRGGAQVGQQGQLLPVMSSSSSGGGGGRRSAKEIEAMGGGRSMISNPDENGRQQMIPAFQQAYLQTGPGPHQHQQQYFPLSSPSTSPVPSQSTVSRAGTAVVVHEDGGRVVERELSPEIPPTYDSLPVDVRRES